MNGLGFFIADGLGYGDPNGPYKGCMVSSESDSNSSLPVYIMYWEKIVLKFTTINTYSTKTITKTF